jgi:hypothetical protein
MARQIIATIPLQGISEGKTTTRYEAEGYAGEGCVVAIKTFADALGATAHEENKAEIYDTEQRHEFLNEGGGS